MTETNGMPLLDSLKTKLQAALSGGEDTAIFAAIAEFNKAKAEMAKAIAEALKKETEALADGRAKLAEKLTNQVRKAIPTLDDQLAKVKATGFTFYLPDETALNHRVGLTVPTIKAKRQGGGGGGGKSKAEFGKSLDQIYQEFKGPEDEKAMAEAIAKDVEVKEKTGKSNSVFQYNVKVAVKKAAIAAGKLTPAA